MQLSSSKNLHFVYLMNEVPPGPPPSRSAHGQRSKNVKRKRTKKIRRHQDTLWIFTFEFFSARSCGQHRTTCAALNIQFLYQLCIGVNKKILIFTYQGLAALVVIHKYLIPISYSALALQHNLERMIFNVIFLCIGCQRILTEVKNKYHNILLPTTFRT